MCNLILILLTLFLFSCSGSKLYRYKKSGITITKYQKKNLHKFTSGKKCVGGHRPFARTMKFNKRYSPMKSEGRSAYYDRLEGK